MSDDSDLLFAAAATAAVVTWMGSRSRERRKGSARTRQEWMALLQEVKEGFVRSWRETPAYHMMTFIRETFFRGKR